ncbi:MAG: sigma 54-interacting transcriptional regulator [Emergencia sp.]|nr:sigma 54-interacting transcriptional regulator [Emergencia sp.]
MDLTDIKEYVQKTARIISSVSDVQVLVCNAKKLILYDTEAEASENCELQSLTKNSVMAKSISERKVIMTEDCKRNLEGCRNCVKRESCQINSIMSIPIMDGNNIYGAIGVYAENVSEVERLSLHNKDFFEFLNRLVELLVMKLHEEEKNRELKETVKKLKNNSCNMPFEDIIGSSAPLQELKEEAKKFAKGNSNILIQGESGTGKEILAMAIHTASGFSQGPFVAINCGAIPENLIESELFGYEDGAFTGAHRGGKIGKFELANGGTLFLDEIGDFPVHLQVKLLRSIQERKIQRIGGTKDIPIDVRIISATNKNLEEAIVNGEFREDLYYRLNVIPLIIPSLIERRDDIGELAEYFLRIYNQALHKDIFGFDSKSMTTLYAYPWPGNIRELQNAVEYAVNCAGEAYIKKDNLPKRISQYVPEKEEGLVLKPLYQVEKDYISAALQRFGTTRSGKEKAAVVLGLSLSTMYRKIKELNIEI